LFVPLPHAISSFDWIVREGTKLTGWFSSLPQHKVLNVFGLLPSIRSPTCIFHLAAEKDVYVTLPRQQQLFDQIPDSVKACSFFVKVSDVGHDGNPLENPDVLLKLRKFYPLSRVQ
jgi:homoserine acetyltransferase